ncbi:MAG: UDP-N-acetylglucosamine 2-epimerase (hydrolyzing) [Leptonema illini]|jgi:GDP/UDP-N,N'-diacetylbacillosamine 2-epimerase (hydrolysing)|uniref:UDP-N-acetylglucosamine 2-epimerase (Hydrolyzing) n=1 Tax=Leptonema illini TaxID=183 RepID=A0A833LZ62_9LEPT|nr:MAG: UDP-N-acetylglucosamine 2-epimerase (hydrolyzing) [Leptonema illini]
MKKICVVTGTRAEYGLLYWLIKAIEQDDELELQLAVTGMHLSPEFGLTYTEIEREFKINKKIDISLSDDTPKGISNSMGLAQIGFAAVYDELKPDIVVVLGDRYEIFAAAAAATVARIPIAHLHGGETTEGAFDEAFRHSITKMSHLHFVAAEDYRKRVIQLGEHPSRVFNVGGLGIDNIKKLNLLSRSEFEESIGFRLNKKNLLVTFHPVTLDEGSARDQFGELLAAIDELAEANIILTKANSDTDGKVINAMCDEYVAKNPGKAVVFASLGQLRYLSALLYVDAVVGNSSSGLLEAPSFKIGTINIGDRQKGRLRAQSVIDCDPERGSIKAALARLYTKDFQEALKDVSNPYGEGGATEQIIQILRKTDLRCNLKKEFFDLPFKV